METGQNNECLRGFMIFMVLLGAAIVALTSLPADVQQDLKEALILIVD